MIATWNGATLAESDATIEVEGNHYFPPESLSKAHFREAPQTTVCGWKGTANYYDVIVGEDVNAGAAWYYAAPKDAAKEIAGYVAFWKGVAVSGTPAADGPCVDAGDCAS
ncbi:MAG: DUF427 domain-containing protein [Planctomycetota bacterium]